MAYGLKERDYTGAMQQGMNYGAQKAEQERRQPIVQQLEQLNLASKKQGVEAGKRGVTLQDLAIKERERKMESEDMADLGKASAWALSQENTAQSWDQALNVYEKQGKPVSHLRGREDLLPMMAELSDPDYAKQKAIQERIAQMIKTMPADKQAQATALSAVDPKALSKSYADSMFQGSGDINQLIAPLNDEQKEQVKAVYSNDQDAAIKLATDLYKQKNKPKPSEKITETQRKAAGFADRMVNAEEIVDKLGGDVSSIDRFVTQKLSSNWMASPDGQMYWNAAKEWTRAKLRWESGAVIGDDEAREEAKTYFPVVGDSKEVVKQKSQLRSVAIDGLKSAAGGAMKAPEKSFEGVDKQAYDWAMKNKSDPRSSKILDKLGVEQ